MAPSSPHPFDPTAELLLFSPRSKRAINLTLTDQGLAIVKQRKGPLGRLNLKPSNTNHILVPYLQVLAASVAGSTVTVASIVSRSTSRSVLVQTTGTVSADSNIQAQEWCRRLMKRAYSNTTPNRKLLVLVNPVGGQGKAKVVWEEVVRPVLTAAGCSIDLQYTGPKASDQHAFNIAQKLSIPDHDAIVSISGDGIVHELLNGLANRPDAAQALNKLPIVPIPAGSGNALSVNLNGPQRAKDIVWATLAAVKGLPIPLDICAVTQEGKQYYSFLSACVGIMADLDLGTEHMRWIGETRFVLGYIQGSLARREYPVELLVNVVASDKPAMLSAYNASYRDAPRAVEPLTEFPPLHHGTSLSPLPEGTTIHTELPEHLEPGWHLLKTSIFIMYAGKLPWVTSDVRMFPVANTPGPSVIDLVLTGPLSRLDALGALDGAEAGKVFWNTRTRYYKVSCVRYVGTGKMEGLVSIDGEKVPGTPWQMESWGGVARVLALNGWYGEELRK